MFQSVGTINIKNSLVPNWNQLFCLEKLTGTPKQQFPWLWLADERQGVLLDLLDFFFNIEKQYYYCPSSFTHVICSTQYIHLKICTCEFHFMLYNLIRKESSITNRTIRWLDKKFGNLGCLILWFCLLLFFLIIWMMISLGAVFCVS